MAEEISPRHGMNATSFQTAKLGNTFLDEIGGWFQMPGRLEVT
jgi:hypothetical protein